MYGQEPWNKNKKFHHINNGIINKNVVVDEYDTYLQNGWKPGYIKRIN